MAQEYDTRAEMDPRTRAVSDTLDDYLGRYHGILSSHTNAVHFTELLEENGLRVELRE